MGTLSVQFKTDPTKDIVNEKVPEYFMGDIGICSSVGVSKNGGDGLFSSVEPGSFLGVKTIDGIQTCTGINIIYTLKSQKVTTFAHSIGVAPGVEKYDYFAGFINILISWQTFTPTPKTATQQYTSSPPVTQNTDPSPTPPVVDPITTQEEYISVTTKEPQTTTEWTQQQVIRREGMNWKCINEYSTLDLQESEQRADDVINDMLPDDETAQRTGQLIISNSEKNVNISEDTVPNFNIRNGDIINSIISLAGINSNERIEGINYNMQGTDEAVIMSFRSRE